MNQQIWQDAAQAIISAGTIPMPITGTLLELLQTIMDEKEAQFIQIFTKPLNMKDIKEKSDLNEDALDKMLNGLMSNGIVTGIPSKSTGEAVYRLLPPIPGLFEFTFMRGRTGEKEKKLARLFDQLFKELSDMVQTSYDPVIDYLKTTTPLTRVIPIEQDVKQKHDDVLPYEDVKMIINKFDKIAISTCYCRHEKELLGKPCHVTKEKENCFSFGQTAEFVIKYKFGRQVSKDEAVKIMEKAKEDGLVHKAFHVKQDTANDEYAICNCCKCCCGTFQIYYMGGAPMQSYASCIASVEASDCTGCGVCEEMCPMEAINLVDDIASVNKNKCIGCGVCSYNCPVSTIKLERTGIRDVFVPPARR
ncbi:MAG: 4Fe-4S binding protein [Deltaproteobacteria bacterium]|nr:4Fe-4S binding protein [Deltaproteobacteria bacterium]